MTTRATGHGHGKTILIGEHHVMDGARALAIGLGPFRTDVTLTRGQAGPLKIVLLDALEPQVAADTQQMFLAAAQSAGLDGEILAQINSTVPMRRGLGSSAALAVAAVRAAWRLADRPEPTATALLTAARDCESVVHGRSSGLDPAAAAGTDPVLFQSGEVLQRVAVAAQLASARWLLVDLGASVPTRDAIAIAIHHRRELGPKAVAALTAQTSAAADAALVALETGDLLQLAAALQSAGEAMEPLGVVNVAMRDALVAMLAAGALAAKQTGAGLGGMLLGLCADEDAAQAVAKALAGHIRSHWTLSISPEKS
jgi:mevalonate kinase